MVKLPPQLVQDFSVARTSIRISSEPLDRRPERFVQGTVVITGTDATTTSLRDGLTTDSILLQKGIQNVNTGISLVNTTEQALGALDDLSSRLQQLADTAVNDTTTNEQRALLDAEAQALVGQINEIIGESEFLATRLFSTTEPQTTSIRAGITSEAQIAYSAVKRESVTQAVTTVETSPILPTPDVEEPDGTFTSLGDVAIAGAPQLSDVELADMNGDGILDLISADNSSVGIQLGNGDGTFSTTRDTFALSKPAIAESLFIADFNGDGNLDVLTAAEGNDGTQNDPIYLGLGDGAGGFTSSSQVVAPNQEIHAVNVADIDNDGNLDILTGSTNLNEILVFYGTGPGTFSATVTSYATGNTVRDVEVADIDGDGNLDLIYAGDGASEASFGILFGNGTRTFSTPGTAYDTGAIGGKALAFDFDGDLDVDVVSARRNNGGRTELTFFENDGSGNLTLSSTIDIGAGYVPNTGFEVKQGDLDGDGDLDVIVANAANNFATVALNDGSGSFTTADYSVGTTPTGVGLGDIDGDGFVDIVTANQGASTFSRLIQDTITIPGDPGSLGTSTTFLGDITTISLTSQSNAVNAQAVIAAVRDALQDELSLQSSTRRQYEQELVFLESTAATNRLAAEGLPSFAEATRFSQRVKDNILQDYLSSSAAQINRLTVESAELLRD